MKHISLLFIFCSFSSIANVKATLNITHYDIHAKTVAQAIKQIRSNGPKSSGLDAWALFRSDISTEYRFQSDATGCSLLADNTTVLGEIIVPKWINIAQTSPKTQRWWRDFSAFILEHENLHYQATLEQAKELNSAIVQLEKAKTCKLARNQYLSLKHKMLNNIAIADKKVDVQSQQKLYDQPRLLRQLEPHLGTRFTFESGLMRSVIAF